MHYTNILKILILISLFSCENSDYQKNITDHPNVSLILDQSDNILSVSKKDIDSWEDHFELKKTKEIISFDISKEHYSIKSISDVLILDSELLILDNRDKELHSLSFNGDQNSPISVFGRGPGELSEPTNLINLDDGFSIVDRVNGIHLFNDQNEYTTTDNIGFIPDYMCKLSNYIAKTSHVIFDGEVENNTIFMVDSNQNIIKRYSRRYQHPNNMLVYYMSSGPVKCISSRELIVNFYDYSVPIIEVIDIVENSELVYYLEDLNPFLLTIKDNTLLPSESNYGATYHTFRNASVIKDRFIVVQYREVNRPKDPNEENYEQRNLSYIIDIEENDVYYSYHFPLIIGISKNKLLVREGYDLFNFILFEYEVDKL